MTRTGATDMAGDDALWAAALAEFESDARRAGLWARAFAEAEGNESIAKAHYLRDRVQQLAEEMSTRQAESERASVLTQARMETERERSKARYLAGIAPAPDDVVYLVHASLSDKTIALLRDTVNGETLLHWCARFDLINEASRLIRSGADPMLRNSGGKSAVDVASSTAMGNFLREAWKAREEALLEKYGISHDGKQYVFREFRLDTFRDSRYDKLSDAVAYAESVLGDGSAGSPMSRTSPVLPRPTAHDTRQQRRSEQASHPSVVAVGQSDTSTAPLTMKELDRPLSLKTKWLRFWNYFSLPIGGVLGLLVSVAIPSLAVILVPVCVLQFAVVYGLHRRKAWAWGWNWILIIGTYISSAIPNPVLGIQGNSADLWFRFLLGLVLGAFIWMWPNYIYWRKRRGLFS